MAFNAQALLDSTIEGSNDTKIIPCPVGDWSAQIDSVKFREWTSKDQSSKGVTLDVLWEIHDEAVKEECQRDKVTVKQGIMLDTTESGSLDMGKGKNVGLGRLREALGMNDAGKPFSFRDLPGQFAKVTVSHRVEGDDIFADVKSVQSAD